MRPACTAPSLLIAALLPLTAFAPLGCEDPECAVDRDCDDGLFCNGDESCLDGRCIAEGFRDCDDHRRCTTDACDEAADECTHVASDLDGDGHFDPQCDGDDCDDSNPEVYSGAPEICDGLDNDCDGVIAEDRDGDGHFDASICPVDGDDCDDDDPLTYAGAPEPCDGVDRNCSGDTDDEADTDGDGFTDSTCAGGDDCDDERPDVHPGAPEVCNGEDDDCSDFIDEGFDCAAGFETECLTDCGFVGLGICSSSCELPSGLDCLGPDELCNGLDDDCDGEIDEDFDCAAGFEAPCTTVEGCAGVGTCSLSCEPPAPGACAPIQVEETCDGLDNDCDGQIDEGFLCAAGLETICETECGTLGTGTCTSTCEAPTGDACLPPAEVCDDFVDNDCDGDEDCVDEDCIGDFACGA